MDRAARHRLGRLAAYLLVVGAFAAGIGAAHRRVDADQTDDLVRSCVRGNALRAAHNRLAAADGRPGLRVPIVDCPAAVRGE